MNEASKNYEQAQAFENQTKKSRQGRWTEAEKYLFQSLIETYGKNWKQIHSKMPNRSLCQIRSHAQKYFQKLDKKKLQEIQRRADLLKALQTLEKAKQQQPDVFHHTKAQVQSPTVKVQQMAIKRQNSQDLGLDQTNNYQVFKKKIAKKQELNLQLNQNFIPNPNLVYMQSYLPYMYPVPPFYPYQFIMHPQQIQLAYRCPITKIEVQKAENVKQEAQ